MTQRSTLLLVHGGWHGAWAWETVAPLLISAGWSVRSVELPSVAEKGGQRFGLHDDADAIRERIQQIDGPVIIIAHSYGGLPVSEAAAGHPLVQHIVYLAAFALDAGESGLSFLNGTMPPWWRIDDDVLVADGAREFLYGDVSAEVADRAMARLKPISTTTITERLKAAAWHDIPSTYVLCEDDRAVPPSIQQFLAARASSRVVKLASGHSPFFSHPSELTRLIVDTASTVCNR